MSHISFDEMAPLLSREAMARRTSLLGIFVAISVLFLLIAFMWQKKFTSYVQIYVDDSQIVAPIVGAEVGLNRDQANVAREELFSAGIMNRIIEEVGYVNAASSQVARERAKKDIIEDVEIYNINNQLLEIAFQHEDPKIAFETTSLLADLFLKKTMASSSEETNEAFDFITNQVATYRGKLEDAEGRLETFRTRYPGISTSTEGNVEQTIVELRRDLERTRLQYAEADQRRKSLERELSSESSTIARDYETSRMNQRISELQVQIETLRRDYTDDYPDIVRLKQQVQDMTRLVDDTRSNPQRSSVVQLGTQIYSSAGNASPVYQQLRAELARTAAEADSMRVRVQQLDSLLKSEIERSGQSSRVERELAELTRDYQINKELYEDLLRRQESARLSMTLGAEKQGVLYRIAQAANFPYLPTGLRFMHIAAGGIVLATILPFVYLIVFLKLDPRIRTASAITDVLELPLLTTIPHMAQPGERARLFERPTAIVATVAIVCALYVVVFFIKRQLENAGGGGFIL